VQSEELYDNEKCVSGCRWENNMKVVIGDCVLNCDFNGLFQDKCRVSYSVAVVKY